MTESKYCTTYCRRCRWLVEVRNKCIHGRKTVLCQRPEWETSRVMMYHGRPANRCIHAAENLCTYYTPKETTSYHQLALESRKITEIEQ